MRYSLLVNVLLFAVAFVNASTASAVTLYDASADFSIAANPNTPWTYGYYDAAATLFTPYVSSTSVWNSDPDLSAWSQFLYDHNSYSVVGKNTTGSVQVVGGSISVDPNMLFTHPGANGEKGTIRWIASDAGTIDITAIFEAADTLGGNRDVHVYLNGSEIYGTVLNGAKPTTVSAGLSLSDIAVLAGDTVDWSVGFGSGGYSNDATMLTAEISFAPIPAPEPGSLLLLGLGACGLAVVRRRKRS